jgi:O-antigen ligase
MNNVLLTKHNSKFLKSISILCAFIIPLLVTGPFLPDLLISTLSAWFLYHTLTCKIYNIYRNFYFYFFICFWLTCILSSLLSDNILFSLKASLFYIRIGIFALLISYLIDQNKKTLDYFYYALAITFSCLIIDGYFQFFTGANLFGYPLLDNRVSSFFGSELVLGSYLARLFPLLFALFVLRANKKPLEVYFISTLFILIDVLIFISGERASFALLNLSTLFIIFFISNYKYLRLVVFIISLCIIFFLTFTNQKFYNRYVKSPIESFGFNQEQKYIFTPSHDSLIRTAFNMFLDKPILGHGPKMFRIKCKDQKYAVDSNSCDVHPHNFYIQLLAETGIVGFLFLGVFFCFFIYLSIKHMFQYLIYKKKILNDYQVCLWSGILITIWPLTSNGNFFSNYLMMFYGLQIGFFKQKIILKK